MQRTNKVSLNVEANDIENRINYNTYQDTESDDDDSLSDFFDSENNFLIEDEYTYCRLGCYSCIIVFWGLTALTIPFLIVLGSSSLVSLVESIPFITTLILNSVF